MFNYNYYVYIITNPANTAIYIGVTNNLSRRLLEHYNNRGKWKTFAGRYYCYKLVYFEHFTCINEAIAREKELKKWRRSKKNQLIETDNPKWLNLNGNFRD